VTFSAENLLIEGRIILGLVTVSNQLRTMFHALGDMRSRLLDFVEEIDRDLKKWNDEGYREVATQHLRQSIYDVFKYCVHEIQPSRDVFIRLIDQEAKLLARIQSATARFHDTCNQIAEKSMKTTAALGIGPAVAISREGRKLIRETVILQQGVIRQETRILDSLTESIHSQQQP
jgi:hypothetical protein